MAVAQTQAAVSASADQRPDADAEPGAEPIAQHFVQQLAGAVSDRQRAQGAAGEVAG